MTGRGDGEPRGGDAVSTVGLDLDGKQAQLVELLEEQLVGQTLATIKTKNELMRQNVEGVKMEAPTPDEVKSPGKAKTEAMGMLLCMNVKRMIAFGGEELSIMLEINFDVVAFQLERQSRFNKLDSDYKEASELLEETITMPTREAMLEAINDLVAEKRYELKGIRDSLIAERRSKRNKSENAESETESDKLAAQLAMDTNLKEYAEDVDVKERRNYKIAMLAYEARLEEVKRAKKGQKLLLNEQNIEQLMVSRLSGYISIINCIVNKIKEYVRHVPDILSTVSMLVRLKGTPFTISNPYETSNLSGLLQNMLTRYFQPSFVTFQQSLMEALGLRITEQGLRDDPVKIVQDVGRIISTWETLKFWKFMTPDMFFTTVLLNALPEGKERSTVVMEIVRHLSALARERGDSQVQVDLQDMSTFNFVSDYMEMVKVSRVKKVAQGGPGRAPFVPGAGNRHQNRGSEMAALAEGTVVTVADNKLYRKEVLPGERVVVSHPVSNKPFSYCATRVACKNCTHSPVCFAKSCHKCGLYGHTEKICRQDPSVFVPRKTPDLAAVAEVRDYGSMADSED